MILTIKNGWRVSSKIKKYEAESATVTDAVNGDRSKNYKTCKKKLLTLETMLKKITTKNLIS
jgi:hypothetical protein